MKHLLMGVETEYALAGPGAAGFAADPGYLCKRLMDRVCNTEIHLRDQTMPGLFLRNGGRFYIDNGSHPEFGTPECPNPWEALAYVRAGDRLMESAVGHVVKTEAGIRELIVLRANVDYSGAATGWGCHESYLHRTEPGLLYLQLVPHLVSRVIYTGAGGFSPLRPGIEFTLSPRAWLIRRTTSGSSTFARGIVHTKDEPHASRGYHRLHLLCGESNCSDVANVLKVGTTALILELVNQGQLPGAEVSLLHPVDALHTFAGHPSCTAEVESTGGRPLTALRIQRHYLEAVEAADRARRLPVWAAPLCRMWRRTLDLLDDGPDNVKTVLDWAIKRTLYQARTAAKSSADRVAEWSAVVTTAPSRMQGVHHEMQDDLRMRLILGLERQEGFTTPFPDAPSPEASAPPPGWSPEEHAELLALRRELFEADLRFGQLGRDGTFNTLEREGALNHRLVDEAEIEAARTTGPSAGRGRVRARLIRRLGGKGRSGSHVRYRCDWSGVTKVGTVQAVDLSNPFARAARWRKQEDAECASQR